MVGERIGVAHVRAQNVDALVPRDRPHLEDRSAAVCPVEITALTSSAATIVSFFILSTLHCSAALIREGERHGTFRSKMERRRDADRKHINPGYRDSAL